MGFLYLFAIVGLAAVISFLVKMVVMAGYDNR